MSGRLTLLALALLTACNADDKGVFGDGGTIPAVPDTETGDTSGGSDTGGSDTGGGTGGSDTGGGTGSESSDSESEDDAFDEPGDIVTYEDTDGAAELSLSDESGDSNKDQEFYLVVVNSSENDITYHLRYTDEGGPSGFPPPPPPNRHHTPEISPFRATLRGELARGRLHTVVPPAAPPPSLGIDDIGVEIREFRVRNDLEDDETYDLVDATLWAVGDSVAIWVDNDLPIDWDYECDGIVDHEAPYDAYGFENCDLQDIADVVDANIFPNLNTVYGDVSDVNGDGLVSVVITPVLNQLPLTSEDEEDWSGVVESYADPEVDLTDWDEDTNPGSDEQEVLYVFAPDPYGAYNPLATTTIDEYTSQALAGQIARAYTGLISYNQHVIENEGEAEEQWMDDALGALGADLVGFGAVFYDDAWTYMDAPHLFPLVVTDDSGSISTESVGAQYLFLRWLTDTYGTSVLASLVQTSNIGVDAVEAATEEDFDDLVVRWQIALLTTGVQNGDGDVLVSDGDYTPYSDATSLSAPTSDPAPGDYYGANGYQTGINIRGTNTYMEGGISDSPTEITENRVVLGNTDHYTHATGFEFYGYVEANYAAQVIRLTSPPYEGTKVEIQGSETGFLGAGVRWSDPVETDYAVENILSTTDANNIVLPWLPVAGNAIYGLGAISNTGLTVVIADGEESTTTVYDTDRWLLDLTDHSPTDSVSVAIWLDRRYNESGTISPDDPWFAVVPASYVPTPTVDGTNGDSCTTGESFGYPASVIEYLYYQIFLDNEAYSDSSDFDPCGTPSGAETTCDEDWDRDGVLDEDEPQPADFQQQVQVQQCNLAGGDSEAFTPVDTDIFDADTLDEDETSTADMAQNLGGMSSDDGEEAFMETILQGGQQYLIVVGAGDGTGTYELTVQHVE